MSLWLSIEGRGWWGYDSLEVREVSGRRAAPAPITSLYPHAELGLSWVMSLSLLSFQAICFPMSSPFVYFHNFEYRFLPVLHRLENSISLMFLAFCRAPEKCPLKCHFWHCVCFAGLNYQCTSTFYRTPGCTVLGAPGEVRSVIFLGLSRRNFGGR